MVRLQVRLIRKKKKMKKKIKFKLGIFGSGRVRKFWPDLPCLLLTLSWIKIGFLRAFSCINLANLSNFSISTNATSTKALKENQTGAIVSVWPSISWIMSVAEQEWGGFLGAIIFSRLILWGFGFSARLKRTSKWGLALERRSGRKP